MDVIERVEQLAFFDSLRELNPMHSITADPAVQATLGQLNQFTEIRDDQGNLLGVFAPADQAEEMLYLRAMAHFDPREMERRKATGERGWTTREVLDYLASLEIP